jgi:predicted P-loop ATPase
MKFFKKKRRLKSGVYKVERVFCIWPRKIEYSDDNYDYTKIIWLDNILVLEKCCYLGSNKWEWRISEYFENKSELDINKINNMFESASNSDIELALGLLNSKYYENRNMEV